jgi:hypothetical protein
MNDKAASWTSSSFTSTAVLLGVGFVVALWNSSTDFDTLQSELSHAPAYFGTETIAMREHSMLQFQFSPQQ